MSIMEGESGGGLSAGVEILRYRLDLDFTGPADFVLSRTEIEFRTTSTDRVEVDIDVNSLRQITLNGRSIPTGASDEGLELRALGPVNVLEVEAALAYNEDGHGLCGYLDRSDDEDRVFVHTKLFGKAVPTAASRLFPCIRGAGRAPFDVSVTAPGDWTCVSNGRVTVRPKRGEAGSWRFTRTPPCHPSALTIAAGPWIEVTAPRLTDTAPAPVIYGRPSVEEQFRKSPIGRMVAECLTWHAKALGVPYPFDSLDVVFLPDYASLGGSFGGVMLLQESLLEASLDPAERRYVLWAVAHEMTHAWFGSLTGSAPGTGWLSEGLATYLGHRAIEALEPELEPWAAFHMIEEAAAHRADHAPDAAPVIRPKHSSIMYAKPAAVLRHLGAMVDETAVLDGLRLWLEQHPFAESTTNDLVRALAEATGSDLDAWADQWLTAPGINTLELRLGESRDGLVESAVIIQYAGVAGGVRRTHHLDVDVFQLSAGSLTLRDRIGLRVTDETTAVPQLVGRPTPALVVPNASTTTYARIRLDDRSRITLQDHLGALPPATRAVCWVAAKEMRDDGLMTAEEFSALRDRHGTAEPDQAVADLITARRSRPGLDPGWECWTSGQFDDHDPLVAGD